MIFSKLQKGLKTVFMCPENTLSKSIRGLRIYIRGASSALSRASAFLSHQWCALPPTRPSLRAAALRALPFLLFSSHPSFQANVEARLLRET